ncbi:MAG: hypothetical protein M0Z53_10895 [Thermaerobacter sp.]|nr:hypothetical protein [Thermaerobacter sp.]
MLVQEGLIRETGRHFYLSFEELRQVVSTNRLDYGIITKRRADYGVFERLTSPRVMTSAGEIITNTISAISRRACRT